MGDGRFGTLFHFTCWCSKKCAGSESTSSRTSGLEGFSAIPERGFNSTLAGSKAFFFNFC